MKTITIKQPWASLICKARYYTHKLGVKDIENRTWPTNFRGRVLVHASAKPAMHYKNLSLIELYRIGMTDEMIIESHRNEIELSTCLRLNGAIIGSVEIVDCVNNHPSIWAEKSNINGDLMPVVYNWVLANPILFPEPIPAKGKLSFWDFPGILAEPEEKDGPLFCHCQLPVKEENQVMRSAGEYYCRYCGAKWYK